MDSKQHINSLDGLRAIAALIVVFSHGVHNGFWFSHFYNVGAIGVSIFFSLSGFLMGFLYLNKEFTYDKAVNYGISRFSRIAPAYLTVIIASYFIYNFFDSNFVYAIDANNLLRHLLFTGNVYVFWSIPPEVQFYVFFVFIWFSIHQALFRHKYTALVICLLIICVFVYFRNQVPGTSLPSKVHFFVFGSIAGMLRHKFKLASSLILSIMQLACLMLIILYGIYLDAMHGYAYPYQLIHYAFITALTVFIVSYPTRFVNSMFANKPLSYIGKWSFSLYLTHAPILNLFMDMWAKGMITHIQAIILSLFFSILFSYLMFQYVERVLQDLIKNRLSPKAVSTSLSSR